MSSLKRAASNASLDQSSPKKKTLTTSFSRVSLKPAKSIFGLRHKSRTESNVLPTSGIATSGRRSLLGSIRSRANTALKIRRSDTNGDDVCVNQARFPSTSTRSRLLPQWDFSFFSRSQPIRIPAGRIDETDDTPSTTTSQAPESPLQLRLQDHVDLGSTIAFSQPQCTCSDPTPSQDPRAPSKICQQLPTPLDPPKETPQNLTSPDDPSFIMWHPSTRCQSPEHPGPSVNTGSSPGSVDLDSLSSQMASLMDKPFVDEIENATPTSIDGVIRRNKFPNAVLPVTQNGIDVNSSPGSPSQSGERPDSGFFEASPTGASEHRIHAESGSKCGSDHCMTDQAPVSAFRDQCSNGPLQNSQKRTDTHVRFALDHENGTPHDDPNSGGSPVIPARSISIPRTRSSATTAHRPPTPSADYVELENTMLSATSDTFKEARVDGDLYRHHTSETEPIHHESEGLSGSKARKSLNRMIDARKKQRGSASSDSVETEFQLLKEGGVKSIKSIVMDGLRGPRTAKRSALWHFATRSSPAASSETVHKSLARELATKED